VPLFSETQYSCDCIIKRARYTVKPVFFACPLFREFREPDKCVCVCVQMQLWGCAAESFATTPRDTRGTEAVCMQSLRLLSQHRQLSQDTSESPASSELIFNTNDCCTVAVYWHRSAV